MFLANGDNTVDLVKDPGLIPYYFYLRGWNAHLCSNTCIDTNNPQHMDYMSQVQGLQLDSVPPSPLQKKIVNSFWRKLFPFHAYNRLMKVLWPRAKHIDVLIRYDIKMSLMLAIVYRLRNPKGVIWCKLDLVSACLPRPNSIIGRIKVYLNSLSIKFFSDFTTVETQEGLQVLHTLFPHLTDKIKYLPDGVDDLWFTKEGIVPLPYDRKENIIVTVARFGTTPKHTEMLLDIVSRVHWQKDWRVIAIGSIEEEFQPQIDTFFQQYPHLKDRLQFIGSISDRKELFTYYQRAKVFVSTSRWESFGIAMVEGMSMGDYLITTPVAASEDFVQGNTCGRVLTTAEEMAQALSDIQNDEDIVRKAYPYTLTHAKDFYMSHIIDTVMTYLTIATRRTS